LGSLLAENARCDKEIRKRIAMAKIAYHENRRITTGEHLKELEKR